MHMTPVRVFLELRRRSYVADSVKRVIRRVLERRGGRRYDEDATIEGGIGKGRRIDKGRLATPTENGGTEYLGTFVTPSNGAMEPKTIAPRA